MSSSRQPASIPHTPAKVLVPLFTGLMLTLLMAAMNQTVLATALPTIVGELNGVEHMSWVISGYIMASTVLMPAYGRISDQFGRKPILIIAILIFLAGSIVGALSQDIYALIISRAVQGMGGGGLMILSQAAIADVVPARERGKYMGFMGGAFALSSVAGPLLGGWITEGPGWRWAFWVNIPLAVIALVAVLIFLKLPPRPAAIRAQRTDYEGMAALSGFTVAIVLLSTWGGVTYDWGSPQIIGLIVAAVVLLALFIFIETKAAHPVIPLHLFRIRNFTLSTVASLLVGVAMFGAIGYIPTYLQMVTGVSATQAGLLMAPMMGGMLITAIIVGQLVTRTGRYKIYPIVGAVITSVGLFVMSQLHVDAPVALVSGTLAFFGIGLGLSNQILTLVVQNSVKHAVVGTATAANNYFRQVGASLGSAIIGSMFVMRLQDYLAGRLPGAVAAGDTEVTAASLTPERISQLPGPIHDQVVLSYNEALLPLYLFIVPLTVATFIMLLFIKEVPLATKIRREPEDVTSTGAIPIVQADDAYESPSQPGSPSLVKGLR